MIVIPAIDLRNSKCVRLLQGDFDRETEYSNDPLAVAHRFSELGFEFLHVVDLDGARTGSQHHQEIISSIVSQTPLSVQVGGGIRHIETLKAWLDSGVSRCVLGSVAVHDANNVKRWIDAVGADQIVLALDVRVDHDDTPILATHGWTRDTSVSLWQCIDEFQTAGLGQVLCTDIGRDGAMQGPNIDLYREIMRRYPCLQLQASGGVRHQQDWQALRGVGAAAAITGRALLDGCITQAEIESFQRDA